MLIEGVFKKIQTFLKLTLMVRLETAPTEWDQVNLVLVAVCGETVETIWQIASRGRIK